MTEAYIEGKERKAETEPKVIIIAGANAVGKGSIVKSLLCDEQVNAANVVRHTTRPRGNGEKNGVAYHFVKDCSSALELKYLKVWYWMEP